MIESTMITNCKAGRTRYGPVAGLAAMAVVLSGETTWAHHDLQKGLTDLLGPNAWALYLIVPVPYVLLGLLGYRIYKALRASGAAPEDKANPRGDLWRDER